MLAEGNAFVVLERYSHHGGGPVVRERYSYGTYDYCLATLVNGRLTQILGSTLEEEKEQD